MSWRYAVLVRSARGAGQDRATVIEVGDALVIALADGAGGTGGGDVAADRVIAAVTAAATALPAWGAVLEEVDRDPRLVGQSTAVVLTLTAGGLRGASVGDSGAWLIHGAQVDDLTSAQQRKPLLGGGATITELTSGPLGDATLLVASDGLLKYARPADIARVASLDALDAAADALVALVQPPRGPPWDDVAVILCRAPRP